MRSGSDVGPPPSLCRRDVFARSVATWGDPRARPLDDTAWGIARPRVLTALGVPAEAEEKLDEMDAVSEVIPGYHY